MTMGLDAAGLGVAGLMTFCLGGGGEGFFAGGADMSLGLEINLLMIA